MIAEEQSYRTHETKMTDTNDPSFAFHLSYDTRSAIGRAFHGTIGTKMTDTDDRSHVSHESHEVGLGRPFGALAELHAQFAESAKLEQAINSNLRGLGYGG